MEVKVEAKGKAKVKARKAQKHESTKYESTKARKAQKHKSTKSTKVERGNPVCFGVREEVSVQNSRGLGWNFDCTQFTGYSLQLHNPTIS